jgi:hypothetical protein
MSKLRALTIELLETDTRSYLAMLQSLSKAIIIMKKRLLKDKLNEELYHSWIPPIKDFLDMETEK